MNWLRPVTIITRRWNGPWGLNQTLQVVAVALSFALAISLFMARGPAGSNLLHSNTCNFPAIFNFGDSNSDTGGKSAAFYRLPYPNGYSFFNHSSGRYCDGRDIIDFLTEKLGLPYLSAYLDSIGTNYRHGANFATGGSTIQHADGKIYGMGYSPISLDIQLTQFEQFKERTLELYSQGRDSNLLNKFDIGQNDLDAWIKLMSEKQIVESLPIIINQFAQAVEKLFELGARIFWIHNTGPIGCLPYAVISYPPKPENTDPNGCMKSHNDVAQEFNRLLKDKVSQLRKQLPDAMLTYTDIYTAKYSLISEAKKHRFGDPFGYCCGHYGDYRVPCGRKVTVNGTEFSGDPCSNPELYISWDGIHYSQAANKIVALSILDGSLSDPPTPINEACNKHIVKP